ncbi:MAG: hypothetical protein ACXACF_03440 [Candidatus Hermodarchaeia archaeon]|jgi:hypothetical protein
MPVVYTYCEKCKAYIAIDVPPDTIERQSVFPFPYSYVHGEPTHVITIYLDQDLVERGHEVSEIHAGDQVEVAQPPPSGTTAPAPPAPMVGTKSRRIVPRVIADLEKQKLSITEFRMLSLCDGQATLQEIAEKMGLQFFIAMRMLLDLQKRKLVDFEKRF